MPASTACTGFAGAGAFARPACRRSPAELSQAFEEAEITRWAPSWVVSNHDTQMWAVIEDMAFPLVAARGEGEWLATTCLVRGRR